MSFVLFHSSSPLSTTITLLPGLSFFSSLFYSSSLIHIQWLNICFGRLKSVANFSLLTATLDPKPSSGPSPRYGPFKHAPQATRFCTIVHASTAMCLISERSRGGSEDKHRALCVSVFVLLIEPSSRRSCRPLWSPTTPQLHPELQRPRL